MSKTGYRHCHTHVYAPTRLHIPSLSTFTALAQVSLGLWQVSAKTWKPQELRWQNCQRKCVRSCWQICENRSMSRFQWFKGSGVKCGNIVAGASHCFCQATAFRFIDKEEEPPIRTLDHGIFGEGIDAEIPPHPYMVRGRSGKWYHGYRCDMNICDELCHATPRLRKIFGPEDSENAASFRLVTRFLTKKHLYTISSGDGLYKRI